MPRDAAGHLVPGRVPPQRPVPVAIPRPEYVGRPAPRPYSGGDVYTPEEVERVRRRAHRRAGRRGRRRRDPPGRDDRRARRDRPRVPRRPRRYPSTLGYRGFPSCCTSLNEVVCHGIPDDTELVEGDLVNIDITAFTDGMHGDLNRTFLVGEGSPQARELVERTEEALRRGIKAVRRGGGST